MEVSHAWTEGTLIFSVFDLDEKNRKEREPGYYGKLSPCKHNLCLNKV